MDNPYDQKYKSDAYFWGLKPSRLCLRVLDLKPPTQSFSVLDVGCGEGRNAVFLASRGYSVAAFDLSLRGLEKSRTLAKRAGVNIGLFAADVLHYRLNRNVDLVLCAGSLYAVPHSLRREILENYKAHTHPDGLHAISAIVDKPFLTRPPHERAPAHPWISGEILTYYHDWKIEFFMENILESHDGGVPHYHAVNALVARKP